MNNEQKVIGMIGGTSWESTVLYYTLINQSVRKHLTGLHSAKILMYSVDYEPIVALENEGKWDDVGSKLANAARTVQEAGADFLILCCNTLHKVTPAIEASITIPFLHIADAAGINLSKKGIRRIGLLGTQFTMEDGFYSSRLEQNFGLEVITPKVSDRAMINKIIYNELCQGKVLKESKETLIEVIESLHNTGAEAILLGCTELGMIISQNDASIPVFDTTELHANEAVRMALSKA